MASKRHNGWANYETWNVALWVGNDEGLYRAMRERRPFTAQTAEEFAREVMPQGTPDFQTMDSRHQHVPEGEGVGPYGYSRVNWREIAAAWSE